MNQNIQRKMHVETDPAAYESFFDHEWARQLFCLTESTALSDATFTLCANWKAAANTHALPSFTIKCMRNMWNGFMDAEEPRLLQVMRALKFRLIKMVPGLSNMKQKQIEVAIRTLTQEVEATVDNTKVEFDSNQIWEEFVSGEISEYRFAIWQSQRLCFCAIYHAFENFVRQCIGELKGDQKYRIGREFSKDVKALYGQDFVDKYINNLFLSNSREIRNAIYHNGGRIDDPAVEAQLAQSGYIVEDEEIHVTARYTHFLFNELKIYATEIAKATLDRIGAVNTPVC